MLLTILTTLAVPTPPVYFQVSPRRFRIGSARVTASRPPPAISTTLPRPPSLAPAHLADADHGDALLHGCLPSPASACPRPHRLGEAPHRLDLLAQRTDALARGVEGQMRGAEAAPSLGRRAPLVRPVLAAADPGLDAEARRTAAGL